MIPDDIVEHVLDAADIVAIVGEHVRLKRVGNSWRGPCPFHQGKKDNFSVQPGRGYRCWTCGETGSVFTFVQKRLGLDFVEAVKYVGQKSGIEVREVTRRTEGPDPREPLWETAAATAEFFQRTLWEDDEGGVAREYLAKRGITRDVAERFGLGVAPRPIGALRRHLEALGIPIERQVAAGVMMVREEADEPRPRFRGRLMFPIHDIRGRVVGFGGRSLDGSEPKYVNSAESAIYSKGSLLYHLHDARHAIRRADRIVIVEGYFDVVRTVVAGVEETVAPLGTALTSEQAALIRRQTANVFLLYDSDEAGLKATFRSGDALLRERASVRVVTLPPGEDPDTFVQKHGAAGLEKELRAAVDIFDRKLQILQRGDWFADVRRTRTAIDRLLPTIRAAADPVTRDLYLTRAAQASGVPRETLAAEVAAGARRAAGPGGPATASAPRNGSPARREPVRHRDGETAERALVQAMLIAPDRAEAITEAIGRIDDEAAAGDPLAQATIRDERLVAIQQALLSAPGADVATWAERLDAEAAALLEELLANLAGIVNLDATVDDSLSRLKARWRKERIAAMRATPSGDPDAAAAETLRLQLEIQQLTHRPPRGASH